MKLDFNDGSSVNLEIDDSELGSIYKKVYKHLTKLPLPFRSHDNPYYLRNVSYNDLVDRLAEYAKIVGITLDVEKAASRDQTYFNYIHKIYETHYNGNTNWLNFHDHIHFCESYYNDVKSSFFVIDYREQMGPLEKPMKHAWFNDLTTNIKAGTIFAEWSELGKNPYGYWTNKEPDSTSRLCELAKPWITLRPKLFVSLRDRNTLTGVNQQDFNSWWERTKGPWLERWNLPDWTVEDMYGVIPIGQVDRLEILNKQLKNNNFPSMISI